jgi:hypothetical protein
MIVDEAICQGSASFVGPCVTFYAEIVDSWGGTRLTGPAKGSKYSDWSKSKGTNVPAGVTNTGEVHSFRKLLHFLLD